MKSYHQKKNLQSGLLLAVLSIMYVVVSMYLYSKYGVKIMNDSPRYLIYAENLSNGIYFDALNFWYISYVFFVAFVKLFSDSHLSIIVAQYVFGFVGMLALYGATQKLTSNTKIAFLAAMIFIFFPDNLMWNSYVLTESFYVTVICVTLYFLVRTWKSPSVFNYCMLSIVFVVCFFSKPTSPALFIALAFPFVWKWLRKPPLKAVKLGSLIVFGVLFLFLANKMISSHRVMLIYEKGDIIFAMHEFPSHPHHDWMTVEVPEDLYKPSADLPLLQQMAGFVISNPVYFSKLFFGKMVMYVSHIRTYWSWSHNISIVLVLWPLYFFCLKSIRKKLIPNYLATASIVYFITHTLVISGTWADWDGRFFVPLVPVMVLIAAIGISDFFNRNPNHQES